jgi:hypothetical protein
MIQKFLFSIAFALSLSGVAQAEIVLGGSDTTMVDNWTTNNVQFNQGTQNGFRLDWENVLTSTATADSIDNKFDLVWETGTNYTIGHLFMYNGTVDLADLVVDGGIQGLDWTANFESTEFANWSPVISVTDFGVTTYYRWNHAFNNWEGNGEQDFSLGIFDLSQLGNGIQAGEGNTGIWNEMAAVPGSYANFGQTRITANNPNLQATTGVLQFGFIQWAQDETTAIANTAFSTAIDSFEVVVNPDFVPPVVPTVVNLPTTTEETTSAILRGEVTDEGNESPTVIIYYGTTDGGDVAGAWENSIDIGRRAGVFGANVTGLERETTYFYRAFATNSAGDDWADTSESVTTSSVVSITTQLASTAFAYRYEMDVDPSSQDLDAAGSANDWRPGGSGNFGIPSETGGIARSNASTSPPGNLFRTDDAGSIQRQSLLGGDFTIEAGIKVIGPEGADAGIFGFALDPGGDNSSFRFNIGDQRVSLDGDANNEITTESNSDDFHVYRIAWVSEADQYTVWRDGVEVYSGLGGTNGPFSDAGGFFIGDFSGSLSGEWEVDYLRLHNEAVAPAAFIPLEITNIRLINGNVEITWTSNPGSTYSTQKNTSGLTGVWSEIEEDVPAASAGTTTTHIFEAQPAEEATFYRVVEF